MPTPTDSIARRRSSRPRRALRRCGRRLLVLIPLLVIFLVQTARSPAAPPASFTASSVHSAEYPAAHAFDGDPRTRWASRASGGPEWLQLDLGRILELDEVTIHWERAHSVEYLIQVSGDGASWLTARHVKEGRGGRETLAGLGARGRYLRIVGLKAGPFGLHSIWEVEFADPAVREAIEERRRADEEERLGHLREMLAGVIDRGARELVFAARRIVPEHWYANFGYCAEEGPSYFGNQNQLYRDGGRLCRLDLAAGRVAVLLDDPRGGVRDPQVHYDARKILFSYRKGGTASYHLYEIDVDGTGLRQLTGGPWDDIEPSYLPDESIVFASSRCKRWVNCWVSQVAVLYRCDADGRNLRPISSNNEHDNTPWPLPDGRILYTRWEYVDRSQVHYHHLWVVNPDGTAAMTFYGNLIPGTVMIGAKPIPGSEKIVACFSPGHGQTEHEGAIAIVDPRLGPDAPQAARQITRTANYRDPWALSERLVLAARDHALVLVDDRGETLEIYRLPPEDIQAGLHCHEPRPLAPRPREAVIPSRIQAGEPTGRLLLADVRRGRNMGGVAPGEIRKLLVLESLPKPINYTGGMDPLSYGGTFTLERVLGTVPVEEDGSAHFEVPALRSVFFVALDESDLAVKRMQSFVTVQPGEVTSCVGCHEPRTEAPPPASADRLVSLPAVVAARREASRIEPIDDAPDVFDFPRDIQPILDALCVDCHGYDRTPAGGPGAGRVILSGDRGPMFSHSYYAMTIRSLFSDGRNLPRSNYPPRSLGSSASRILAMLDGSHHGVRADDRQKRWLRLWIETGAAYPGTYAALGTGMIGGYAQNHQVDTDRDWPAAKAAAAVIGDRCARCHQSEPSRLLPLNLSDERGVSFWQPEIGDPRLETSRHIVFNLSRPEKSLILLAPLAEAAGGWGLCRDPATGAPAAVFESPADPGYQALLSLCRAGRDDL
ncbi:MAG: discoidin domain-containing protein, partial [Planctomycetes bacterium]|nr:discoidin domain-containing protein [Planctomycetota bacterium]